MAKNTGKRLSSSEVEMVLRRAAELSARRRTQSSNAASISPEVLVQVAAAAGIPEADVRRAIWDLASDTTAEPDTLGRKLYGPSRLRAVREVRLETSPTRDHLETLLRLEQGLKLRRKTEGSSLWDAGDLVGVVRRALDFSGNRTLLKARSVELRVEDVDDDRCGANITADVSNQRSEYLSLGGVLGATFAVPLTIAGFQEPLFFFAVLPALAAPAVGFRLAYMKACSEIRNSIDGLLDAAEDGPPRDPEAERGDRPPGQIRGLKPIPRFAPKGQK
jgi:hypothetical protein